MVLRQGHRVAAAPSKLTPGWEPHICSHACACSTKYREAAIPQPHQRQRSVQVAQQRRQHAQHAAQRAQHDQPHEQAAVLQRPGQHALRRGREVLGSALTEPSFACLDAACERAGSTRSQADRRDGSSCGGSNGTMTAVRWPKACNCCDLDAATAELRNFTQGCGAPPSQPVPRARCAARLGQRRREDAAQRRADRSAVARRRPLPAPRPCSQAKRRGDGRGIRCRRL